MAGHSKWANIKHRKGAQDKKKTKIFACISKEMKIAIKEGGSDPDNNSSLRLIIEKAKANNIPKDNIQNIIDKATKEKDKTNYFELTYEGYGPGGVAIFVVCLTDNINRTVASIKSYFLKGGGNLGTDGSVAYLFETKGILIVDKTIDEEIVFNTTIKAGATDFNIDDDIYIIETNPKSFMKVKKTLDELGYENYQQAEITKIPIKTKEVDDATRNKVYKLVDLLEDDDDVQDVFTNLG